MFCKVDVENDYAIKVDTDSILHIPQFVQILKGPYGLNGLYYLYLFSCPHPFGALPVEDRESRIRDIINRKPLDPDKKKEFERYYRTKEMEAAIRVFNEIYPNQDEITLRNRVNELQQMERAGNEIKEGIIKQLEEKNAELKEERNRDVRADILSEIEQLNANFVETNASLSVEINKQRKIVKEIKDDILKEMPPSKVLGLGAIRKQLNI